MRQTGELASLILYLIISRRRSHSELGNERGHQLGGDDRPNNIVNDDLFEDIVVLWAE